MKVHQMLPSFSYGDAIGNHTRAIRDILREAGYESQVFCYWHHPRLASEARFFVELEDEVGPDDIVIYHYSLRSPLTLLYQNLRSKRILIYHNITPYHFFLRTNPVLVKECYYGRKELPLLAPYTDLALGDSSYNEQELKETGYKRTGVLPIIIDFDALAGPYDRSLYELFSDGKVNVIFVGRVINNKKFEDVIKIFYYYQRFFNPNSRLILVGEYRGFERYFYALKELVEKFKLKEVIFTGHVTHEELLAIYRSASVFVCMSEHEGFCVPLVEAFFFKVPVIAYACCAVEETMNGAGILVRRKDFPAIAATIDELMQNPDFKNRIIEGQTRALEKYRKENVASILLSHIRSLL